MAAEIGLSFLFLSILLSKVQLCRALEVIARGNCVERGGNFLQGPFGPSALFSYVWCSWRDFRRAPFHLV